MECLYGDHCLINTAKQEESLFQIVFISFKLADISIDGFRHLNPRLVACEIRVCVCYTLPVS